MYSIIDIETTGTRSQENKITEIAIINFDGKKVTDTFQTLIDPEISIPPFIQRLTGITDEMVSGAPKFYEIAKKIIKMTEGNIFVAHNVHFDFNFIQQEFRELAFPFRMDKLCTVRLSRKIIPGHKSYSLGKICEELGIANNARHRAMGDAEATLELFKILLKKDEKTLSQMHKESNASLSFPPYLNPKEYESLPDTPGVYYLWDKKGQLLYIGKSVNIKKRVTDHFKVKSQRTKEMIFKNNIAQITFRETGSNLAAELIECQEIKNLRPLFNRSMNKKRYPYGVEMKKDDEGRIFFNVTSTHNDEVIEVGSKVSAKSIISKMYTSAFGIRENTIFENQMHLIKNTLSLVDYNKAMENEFNKLRYPYENFQVITKGRQKGEKCLVHIENFRINHLVFKSDENTEEKIYIEENRDSHRILLAQIKKESALVQKL